MLDESPSMNNYSNKCVIEDKISSSLNNLIENLQLEKTIESIESKQTVQISNNKINEDKKQDKKHKNDLVPKRENLVNSFVPYISKILSLILKYTISNKFKANLEATKFEYALSCIKNYLSDLQKLPYSSRLNISFITFDHKSSIIITNKKLNILNVELDLFITPLGVGTSFGPAFIDAIKCLKNDIDSFNILQFYTDGEASYPQEEINVLKKFYNFKLYLFIEIMDDDLIKRFKNDLGDRVEVKLINMEDLQSNFNVNQIENQLDKEKLLLK